MNLEPKIVQSHFIASSSGFSVKAIADSVHSETGSRLLTVALRYPRFIHAEVMTHRVFSRNASSSRAIPSKRIVEAVQQDPAMFVHVGANRPGMQARAEVDLDARERFEREWCELAQINAAFADRWAHEYGVHKQVANRVLEPWQWMETLVTSSDWQNFFDLRCHPDAQPEFQLLASLIRSVYESSKPRVLRPGEWHTPFVRQALRDDSDKWDLGYSLVISSACCAWTSYRMPGLSEEPGFDKCMDTFRKLVGTPMHASPLEHQARALAMTPLLETRHLSRNFARGWAQHRALREEGVLRAEDLCTTN